MIIRHYDHLTGLKADHFVVAQGAIKGNLWMFWEESKYIYSINQLSLSSLDAVNTDRRQNLR